MSPSLRRARAPYFLRNSLVGTTLALFVGGIYVYSISAVSQDDFVSFPLPLTLTLPLPLLSSLPLRLLYLSFNLTDLSPSPT